MDINPLRLGYHNHGIKDVDEDVVGDVVDNVTYNRTSETKNNQIIHFIKIKLML